MLPRPRHFGNRRPIGCSDCHPNDPAAWGPVGDLLVWAAVAQDPRSCSIDEPAFPSRPGAAGAAARSVFPSDPHEQLASAATAVFRSWDAPKAASYRRLNGISDDTGTAVAVQTMVYGNAGGESGAGVAFTRNPATGAREMYFDFQFNTQGEDVVAGRHRMHDNERLRLVLPAVWARLNDICRELEALFGDAGFRVHRSVRDAVPAPDAAAKRADWAAVMTR